MPRRRALLARLARAGAMTLWAAAGPAFAAPADAVDPKVQALERRIEELERKMSAQPQCPAGTPATDAAVRPEPQSPAPVSAALASSAPAFKVGPLTVTLGGFIELMAVGRSHNEAADFATNWNSDIPFQQSNNRYLSEFHLTERQSQIAALVQGPTSAHSAAEAYVQADAGAAASGASNNQASGFSPRVLQLYADYAQPDAGWYLLFGQAWSLIVQQSVGMAPRSEHLPLTSDGQYVPGFTWLRVPQLRAVKSFGTVAALGVSLENPAALLAPGSGCATVPAAVTTPVCDAPAGSGYAAGRTLTLDPSPDLIAKASLDPGWGHYELFGMLRAFRDQLHSRDNVTYAYAGGGSALLPLVPNKLEFSASVLAGPGIGRYGSAQLPDVTLQPGGRLRAIRGYSVLAGLSYAPTPWLTLYSYRGREHDDRTDFPAANGNTYLGYGSPLYDNSLCLYVGTSGACAANTSSIAQTTFGGWWRFYQGTLGNMQLGTQLTYARRDVYPGISRYGVTGAPGERIHVAEISFRYYPYQN